MRILIAEPDDIIRESIELMLRADGHTVETAPLGGIAMELVSLYKYDILVAAALFDDMTALDMLRGFRLAKQHQPAIILAREPSISDKCALFRHGADDVLEMPFHRDELVARICAVVRRWRGFAVSSIEIGDYRLDLDLAALFRGHSRIHLSRSEYRIVEALALGNGRTLTKETILGMICGQRDEPEIKIIDVFVCKIRKKAPGLINTIWGRGYCINCNAGLESVRGNEAA